MYYEVFPFGKYKGVKLTELPSTYIVLSLEKFELPDELQDELSKILLGRFNIYSRVKDLVVFLDSENVLELLCSRIKEYEK
jgi:hypothetical protein